MQFNFICLTDVDVVSDRPIKFINVDYYSLDTWWNKVLIFDQSISGPNYNLYFDLDTKILNNLDFLLQHIEEDSVSVIDTIWKDQKYFNNKYFFPIWYKRADAFFAYGNSSVMGWIGNKHQYLVDLLFDDLFKHTTEHYGDDTFINKYGKIKYFPPVISREFGDIQIENPVLYIHYKTIGR